jgi:hypothetical protein
LDGRRRKSITGNAILGSMRVSRAGFLEGLLKVVVGIFSPIEAKKGILENYKSDPQQPKQHRLAGHG